MILFLVCFNGMIAFDRNPVSAIVILGLRLSFLHNFVLFHLCCDTDSDMRM